MGGAVIERDTTLLPLSLVLKEMNLRTATYEGSPAEPVSGFNPPIPPSFCDDEPTDILNCLDIDEENRFGKNFKCASLTSALVRKTFYLLFLKSIDSLVLRVNEEERLSVQRLRDGSTLLISGGSSPERIWYLEDGDFDNEAHRLRTKYSQIESRRRTNVSTRMSAALTSNAGYGR